MNTPRRQIVSVIGPALCVIVIYGTFSRPSITSKYSAERAKLAKLESTLARRGASDQGESKLARANEQLATLSEQLRLEQEQETHLVSRRSDLLGSYLHSDSPAATLSHLVSLLERNGLQCLECSSLENEKSRGQASSLKPVAELIDGTDKLDVTNPRREFRIVLRGRFAEMQSAMREIQVAPLGIFTLALEMDDSNVHTEVRRWILVIAI